ncbi:MAG: hypothetical protein LLG01_02050 [Planctomycetaceae bacterium]|nr:hypothetical protein [Planctomycetaceae bacterium]
MNEILAIIMRYFSFLYEEEGFRFVDSRVYDSGSAYVVLAGKGLYILFSVHHSEWAIDISKDKYGGGAEVYPLEMMRAYLAGNTDKPTGPTLDKALPGLGKWFRKNVESVCDALSIPRQEQTRAAFIRMSEINKRAMGL